MRTAAIKVRLKEVKPGAPAYLKKLASISGGATVLPAWDAAGAGSRSKGWLASSSGINTLIVGHAATLRNRSRDQIRRNPWARQATDRFVSNAIGTGIKPKSRHPDEATRARLHEAWFDWTDESDPEGIGDFYEQQAVAVRAIFESGEVFVRLRPRLQQDGLSVPLQVQMLEAEHVPLSENRIADNGNMIISGIEFDRIGRRVAYHMYRQHPGEFIAARPGSGELVRVPAAEVLHLFVRDRPGQVRGVPRLSTILTRLLDLDQYEDAELVRKKVAAIFTGFVIPGVGEDGTPLVTEKPDEDGYEMPAMEPGLMAKLPPGSELKFAAPAEVGTSYDPFMNWMLHGIAAGSGITYEMLTGDLSDVNFSSIRAGLLEFRRGIEQFQHNTPVYQLNRPVWHAWLDQAALAGAIPVGEYRANRRAYRAVDWIPQGWPWVDPEKEQRAAVRSVRAGFDSRARVVSGRGEDIETIDKEIAEDNARADRLGLVLDSDPRVVSQAGLTQARAPGSQIPEAGVFNPEDGGDPSDDEQSKGAA